MRPVLRWFGGKFILAPWIISHFPAHRVYVEPFGGAASVLMRKPRSYAEVYNDLDDGVVNLFNILRVPETAAQLRFVLEHTPFSRREFDLSYCYSPYPLESARRLVIRSFMGFGSNSANVEKRTGFRSNSNRSGSTPAHDWANYPKSLDAFAERLRGVVIENLDACDVMKAHDGPETLHYVDPPYPHETRGRRDRYFHEMTTVDHERLIDTLKSLKGKIVVSGYEYKLYTDLGWRSVSRETLADGARKRTERLWFNFEAEDFF